MSLKRWIKCNLFCLLKTKTNKLDVIEQLKSFANFREQGTKKLFFVHVWCDCSRQKILITLRFFCNYFTEIDMGCTKINKGPFKGPAPPPKKKKNLYYSFDRDENLHTYVKSKIKLGKCWELFSILFIKNELFTENVKKGGPR